jgi:hypothetical protein
MPNKAPERVVLDPESTTNSIKDESDRQRAERRLIERKKQLFLDNPALSGLSPLYADYDAACWWWQILNFIVTLLLCGPVLLLQAEAASQVFIQLLVSTAMAVALANKKPYLHSSDDLLAQMCQIALSFTMAVGLFEMAAVSFQDDHYGPILITCTTVQFSLSFIAGFVEWVKAKMPHTVSKLETFFNSWSAIETTDIVTSRRLNPALVQQSRRKTNAVVPEGVPQTPHVSGPVVSHGDQAMQELSAIADGGRLTTGTVQLRSSRASTATLQQDQLQVGEQTGGRELKGPRMDMERPDCSAEPQPQLGSSTVAVPAGPGRKSKKRVTKAARIDEESSRIMSTWGHLSEPQRQPES